MPSRGSGIAGGVLAPVSVQRTCATAISDVRKRTFTSVMVRVLSRKTNAKASVSLLSISARPPPPPADHVNDIAVFGEQGCVGFGVVLVPRLLLSRLHDIANCSLIGLLISSHTRRTRSHHENGNRSNSKNQIFHAAC
jgi:hypothetical protein